MFNIVSSLRPVAVLETPAFFKSNTYQIAVALTVPLSDKDVPLMVAILRPLESNQQRYGSCVGSFRRSFHLQMLRPTLSL